MKHGDKKSKAASKAAGKKSIKAVAKSSKAGHVVKGKNQQARSKTDKQIRQTSGSTRSHSSGDNGKTRPRLTPADISFSNPVVATAFKRALKKYPNAFRRLTD
jgi:hypothetical protein